MLEQGCVSIGQTGSDAPLDIDAACFRVLSAEECLIDMLGTSLGFAFQPTNQLSRVDRSLEVTPLVTGWLTGIEFAAPNKIEETP